MTDADFLAAIVDRAPELNDKQITGLRQLLAPVTVGSSTPPATSRRASTRPHTRTSSDVAAEAA